LWKDVIDPVIKMSYRVGMYYRIGFSLSILHCLPAASISHSA
jgi:hypothetical protein